MKITVCPHCKGRATKFYNISTGLYFCQQCQQHFDPTLPADEQGQG